MSLRKIPKGPLYIGVLTLITVVVVTVFIFTVFQQKSETFSDQPVHQPSEVAPITNSKRYPHPTAQSADCPDVEVISIPGTWETSSRADPHHPNPRSLLAHSTTQLAREFSQKKVETFTVPYPAQFKNPNHLTDITYDESRMEGQKITFDRIQSVYQKCSLTHFILTGFSQGAVIAGDILSKIGQNKTSIDPQNIAFAALVADGRRIQGQGIQIPNNLHGEGAEVVLQNLQLPKDNLLTSFIGLDGITLRGPRTGGFGVLNSHVYQLCAPNDPICDSPAIEVQKDLSNVLQCFNMQRPVDATEKKDSLCQFLQALQSPIHGEYGTHKYWVKDNKTAPEWIASKIESIVRQLPAVPHS